MRRIAVFRALALGDMLCSVPALRSLRAANPDASISLIGLPWAREFAARFDRYVDEFVEFPGWEGLGVPADRPDRPDGRDAAALDRLLREARANPYDLAIQLHGDGSISNGFIRALGARVAAGYRPADDPACLADPAGSEPESEDAATFAPYPECGTEIGRLLGLMEFLGYPSLGSDLEMPVSASEISVAEALMRAKGLHAGEYVCVHAGASVAERRWPASRFAAVADRLAARGHHVVLTGGPSEADLVAQVHGTMSHRATNLAGRTGIGVAAVLIARSRLLVSSDTGISHVAAAVRTPSVVVFVGSDPERWAPLDRARHRAVGGGDGQGISVAEVWRAVEEQLSFPGPAPRQELSGVA